MFGGLYTGNEASSKSILNKTQKSFLSGTPDPAKQNAAAYWQFPEHPGVPQKERGDGPPWGEARNAAGRPNAWSIDGLGQADRGARAKGLLEGAPTQARWDPCPRVPAPLAPLLGRGGSGDAMWPLKVARAAVSCRFSPN